MARLKRTAMSDDPVPSDPVAKKARVEAVAEADDAPEGEAAGVPPGEADLANGGQGEAELPPTTEEEERVDQAIDGLAAVQHELEQVNDEASMKVLEVEMEYNRRRKPVYEKRARLIRDIEQFWLHVFMQHPHTRSCLREDDTEAMACLEEVDITDLPDIKSGFTVTFRFAEGNTLFANRELRKEYRFMEDGMLMVTGTEIDWLVELALEPEPQDPSGRYLVERGESFFTWFDPPDQGVPLAQDIDSTAEALKDDIWPNPYKFYIGEIGLDVGLPPGNSRNPIWIPDDEEEEEDEFEGDEEYDADAVQDADYVEWAQYGDNMSDDPNLRDEDALAGEEAALETAGAGAEAQGEEEEDAEVKLVVDPPGIAGGGAHDARGGGDPKVEAEEEEEYYDDEGADHDREDDEE